MRQLLHIRLTRLNSHQFVCDYLLLTLFLCDVKLSNQNSKNKKRNNKNKIKMKKKQPGVLKRLRSPNLCIKYYIYTCSFFLDNSSCCWRLCCSRTRPLQMITYDNEHIIVMELNRPYRCRCSLSWCCCLQLMTMKNPLGMIFWRANQE